MTDCGPGDVNIAGNTMRFLWQVFICHFVDMFWRYIDVTVMKDAIREFCRCIVAVTKRWTLSIEAYCCHTRKVCWNDYRNSIFFPYMCLKLNMLICNTTIWLITKSKHAVFELHTKYVTYIFASLHYVLDQLLGNFHEQFSAVSDLSLKKQLEQGGDSLCTYISVCLVNASIQALLFPFKNN